MKPLTKKSKKKKYKNQLNQYPHSHIQITNNQKELMKNFPQDSFENVAKQITLHLKIKKLSTNSPGDFDTVLDSINHYWIDPAK